MHQTHHFEVQFFIEVSTPTTHEQSWAEILITHPSTPRNFFYRAMHYSAKRSLAIACRLSVCPSVCDVGGSGPRRLKILETNCANN